jgi:glycerol-1-phosphate dehydrogenase [NAD(P)+]
MSEKSRWIKLPRNVLVGHGMIDEVGEAVGELGLIGTALLVTSPTPNEIAGERVRAQFDDIERITIDHAGYDSIERVTEAARETDAAYLVALGGGKVIDVAKMAAEEVGRGFVSVPTAASHDGIVSGRSSIPEGQTRHSVAADPPLAVVADTEIMAQAPWTLTTAGCADIISNYTAVKDWRLAHRLKGAHYSEYAGALSEMTAEMLVGNADSIKEGLVESSWLVSKALVSSGVAMSIAGSSRPASGAEHLFSHQLDRIAPDPALHGHQVGVGSIMIEYLHTGEDGGWRLIRDALDQIGAPTTADDLGISEDVVLEALTTAHEIRDRYTILGDGMSEPAVREVAEYTGVI